MKEQLKKVLKEIEEDSNEFISVSKEQLDDLSEDEKTSWEVIKDLAETDFKGSNEAQNKGVQLLKGLANAGTEDDPNEVADFFMERLSDAYTDVAQDVATEFDLDL